ncbi:MAG: hypothetical protein J6A89_03255 [Clostridia bacterium]|nr:hypothetical protein [Clostridia bacterium]
MEQENNEISEFKENNFLCVTSIIMSVEIFIIVMLSSLQLIRIISDGFITFLINLAITSIIIGVIGMITYRTSKNKNIWMGIFGIILGIIDFVNVISFIN